MNARDQNTAAPSGVVTFLFTDIEGSTRRWDADSDGMRSALAAHDDLMRETVEAHKGWLFKHTGDGVCAVFASPRSAVQAAATAQRALELPVRIGIANRYVESTISIGLSRLAANHGDPIEAIDHLVLAIRNYHDSGSFLLISGPLAMIAVLLDRLGRYEPAATIMGFGDVPGSRLVFPEVNSAITHLREVHGDQAYESLARAGASMTTAAIVAYAFDEIDRARAELLADQQT